MRRSRHSYPAHPYPVLLTPPMVGTANFAAELRLTRFESGLLRKLKSGARVLFDMEQGRAMLYAFRRGIEALAEVTIRTLSRLVQAGHLYVSGREGRLVHFTLHGSSPLFIPASD